jgi:hypothetical protein
MGVSPFLSIYVNIIITNAYDANSFRALAKIAGNETAHLCVCTARRI